MTTDPNRTPDTDELTEDTEGHAIRAGKAIRPRGLDGAGEDDTIDDDTEGHAFKSGRLDAAGEDDTIDDDTEGHAIRKGF